MSKYTLANIKKVEDMAPKFGHAPNMEVRFARKALEMDGFGLTYQKLAPNHRVPFNHKHKEQEEVFLVLSGSARAKLDDEVVELKQWDALRVSPATVRGFEAGAGGTELLVIGNRAGMGDTVMADKDFWNK